MLTEIIVTFDKIENDERTDKHLHDPPFILTIVKLKKNSSRLPSCPSICFYIVCWDLITVSSNEGKLLLYNLFFSIGIVEKKFIKVKIN